MRPLTALVLLVFCSAPCNAQCDLDTVVGYTLVAKKTIAGYIQDDVRKDDFDGCDFDGILVFDDNTGVRCAGYSYHYAYRPSAYIFVTSNAIKLCIDGNWFDARSLH